MADAFLARLARSASQLEEAAGVDSPAAEASLDWSLLLTRLDRATTSLESYKATSLTALLKFTVKLYALLRVTVEPRAAAGSKRPISNV
jgi:hypothetical protein